MTKKLLCLVMAVAMLSAMFTINAGATSIAESGLYAEEDFTRPEEEMSNADWKPDGWGIGGRNGLADTTELAIGNVTDEGYVELCKGGHTGSGAGASIYKTFTLPEDFTLMFDVRYPETSGFTGALYVHCSLNGYEQCVQTAGGLSYLSEDGTTTLTQGTGGHEANVWYTYVFQVKGDRMSVYRKKASDSTFTRYLDNVRMNTRSGNEFYAYSTSETAYINFDNIKIFTGTFAKNLDLDVDETRVFVEADIHTADIAPETTMTITPILAAFDAKGKVLDMEFGSKTLNFNVNDNVEFEMDITSEMREQLSGGQVEFYMCDGSNIFKPLTAKYSMDVN